MAYLCFEIWLTASLVSLVYHQNNYYFGEKQPTLLEEATPCNSDDDHPMLNTQLLYNRQTYRDAIMAVYATSIHARGSFVMTDKEDL